MAIDGGQLVSALRDDAGRWCETAVHSEQAPVRWYPMVLVSPIAGSEIGIDERGRWLIGRPRATAGRREAVVIDTPAQQGLVLVTPLLDWLPRTVMHRVDLVAERADLPFEDVWDLFPWRFVLHAAFERGKLYEIKPAVDWARYLGVFEEHRGRLEHKLARLLDDGIADASVDWIEQALAAPPLLWWPADSF